MHKDLLGYLLGALEPDEMRRVAQWLRDDPEAQSELERLQRALEPLEEICGPVEPPPSDLVARTLDSLPPLPPAPDDLTGQDRTAGGSRNELGSLTPMGSGIEVSRKASMTWLDWVGGATAAAVILGLMLPMLAEGRFQARNLACQDRLRQFGTTLTQFVNRDAQGRLPAVTQAGPEAFAGVYAVRLNDAGLLQDPTIRWCPSLDLPSDDQVTLTRVNEIVTVPQLHQAPVDQLRQIQQFAGGHYAYTLGVMDQNRLTPPRFEARSSFAVMSDAPLMGVADRRDLTKQIGHSAAGINVLYEDGRVRFIPISSLDAMPDHPLVNHRGEFEAGVNVDDASLAPSWRPPFANVRQR